MERRLYYITLISMVTGVILSCFLFWLFYQVETKSIQREFESEVIKKADAITKVMELHFEALYNVKLAYDNYGPLEPNEFTVLASTTLARYPNIQALEWIPRVTDNQRSEREAQAAQRIPGFMFTERVASGEMVRATDRMAYYPVYYLEPVAGNEAALGYDLGSNSLRLDAIHRARDSGEMQLSQGLKLVQAGNEADGLLSFIPVYRTASPSSLKQRRESLLGFVLGVFRLGEILTAAYIPGEEAIMRYSLIDVGMPTDSQVLLRQPQSDKPLIGLFDSFSYSRSVLELGGRRWVLEALPTIAYYSQKRTLVPWLVFAGSVVFFVFVTGLGYVTMKRNMVFLQKIDTKNQELHIANATLERLTKIDGLTGIANRRHFDEFYEQEFRRALREEQPIALLVIDIDYFKQFNDTYGHQAGDRCLKLVANELKQVLKRPADMIARIGGEEFGILLPNTTDGEVVAKKCLTAIERLAIEHLGAGDQAVITISIGVVSAESVHGHTIDSLFNTADVALYQAKRAGRNRVRAIKVHRPLSAETASLC